MSAAVTLAGFLASPQSARAAILADLDGCLVSGAEALPGAETLVARHGKRLWVVSNNSEDTARSLSARLGAMGLPLPASRLFLAGEQTLRAVARRHPGARVALFGSLEMRSLARTLGLRPDMRAPDLAVLARFRGFTFGHLSRLVAMAHRGVPVWLTNPDTTHPAADGSPRPETGAIWAALAAAVPLRPAGGLGKPAPDMVLEVLEAAGVAPEDAVFLGDSPATDGAAARAAGVEFIAVSHFGTRPDRGAGVVPLAVAARAPC